MVPKLLKSASKYSLANLLVVLSGLISFPILTRSFSVEDYGTISLINVFVTFWIAISKAGMQHAITRFYSECREEARLGNFFSTAILGLFAISISVVVALVLAYLISESVNSYFNNSLAMSIGLLLVLGCLVTVQSLSSGMLNIFLAMERSNAYSALQVLAKYMVLVAIVITVLFIDANIEYFFMAMLVGELLAFVFVVKVFSSESHSAVSIAAFDAHLFKAMALYSLPMLGYEVTTIIHILADRLILDLLMGKTVVGLYSAAYNVAEMFNTLIAVSLSVAVQPAYFKLWATSGKEATLYFLNRVVYFYILLIPAVVWGVIAISEDLLVLLTTDKYIEGAVIFPFVVASGMINATALIYAAGIYIYKRTMQLFVPVLICSILNLVLNFLLIPEFGIRGAAGATLISMSLLGITMFLKGRATLRLDFPIGHLLKCVTAASAMGLVVQQLSLGSPALNIIAKVFVGVSLYGLIALVIDKEVRQLAGPFWRKVVSSVSN
ncbi:MAG: oligosaccharide flippase family protein [Pseudomonadota bacterium]